MSFTNHKKKPEELLKAFSQSVCDLFEPQSASRKNTLSEMYSDFQYNEIRHALLDAFVLTVNREDQLLIAQQLMRIAQAARGCSLFEKSSASQWESLRVQFSDAYQALHQCVCGLEEAKKPPFGKALDTARKNCLRAARAFGTQEQSRFGREQFFMPGLSVLCSELHELLYLLEYVQMKNT